MGLGLNLGLETVDCGLRSDKGFPAAATWKEVDYWVQPRTAIDQNFGISVTVYARRLLAFNIIDKLSPLTCNII